MTTYIEDKVAEVPTLTLLGKRTKTVQKKIKSIFCEVYQR